MFCSVQSVLKPKFPAEIRSRRPEQFCNVGFRVTEEDVQHLKSLQAENNLSNRFLGKI